MQQPLKLIFFGAPTLMFADQPLTGLITGKALALFTYLAVMERPQSRDVLADLLWSELNNQQARNNLRYVLPDLRQFVDDYLLITPRTVGFNTTAPYDLDVKIFQSTLTAQPEQIKTVELQAALDLYQGEFLDGFTVRNAPVFEEWVTRKRNELHTLAVRGYYVLAERYWQTREHSAGLAATQRLLTLEPWHEAGHRLRMLFLAHNNQRTAALAQFAQCQAILANELDAEPEAETIALYEQIRHSLQDKACEPQGASPVSTTTISNPTALPHNLSNQLTPFLGREEEVAALCTRLFAPDCRLITLVGEGGIGKTRLAIAVAQKILDLEAVQVENRKFPDGIWFASLAGIPPQSDALDAIVAAIGEPLGVHFTGTKHPAKQLFMQIRERQLLLIIDNFEHLINDATFVLDLLREAPGVRILVTSRQRLNFQAEIIWHVAGLPVPTVEMLPSLSLTDLRQYDSIALFLERTQRVQRAFTLNCENHLAVAKICCLVSGLPLGIELAAALTQRYTVDAIAAALAQNYKILSTKLRDLPQRHRSLQATLAYSWQLLSPEIADILAQCALFQGRFDSTAAAVVTAAPSILLAMLEEQSLLHQVRDRSGNVRYELHSMVRQFVSEQLAQRPVLREQATTRYCRYYIELLASLKTALLNEASAQQQVWLELENIRAAWAQCVDQGQIALLGQGLDALANFYETAGLINEAAQVFQTAIICVRRRLAHQATEDHVPLLARLLATSARFYCLLGQFEKCESAATEAIAIGQHIDIPIAQALAYQELTRAAYARGQYSAMHTLAEQGLAIASRTGALGIEAALLNLLGVALGVQGKYQGAIEHNLAALACLQQAPNAHQEASVTAHLGFMYSYRREFTLALHYATRSITLAHTFNSIYNLGVSYILLGDLWRELGFYARAQQAYEQAQPHIQTLQVGYWQAWWAVSSGHLALAQGNASAAYKHYTTALTLAQEGQMVSVERWALTSLGHWQAAQGEVAEAEQCYRNALTIQQQANLVMNVTDAMAGLAELYLARQEFTTAQTFVEEILSYLTQYGLLVAEAPFQVYQTCYRVLKANCDPRALEVLQQAQSLLLEQAANLQDETVRRSFLQNVAVNQALLTLARSHCNLSRVALYPFNAPAKRPRINNLPKAR